MNLVIDPGSMSGADVFAGDGASTESVAVGVTEDACLGVGSELEEGGRSSGIDGGRDWSRDGCGGWHAPHRQWRWQCLIQVGSSGVGLISWPRDTCHMVREMHRTLCI